MRVTRDDVTRTHARARGGPPERARKHIPVYVGRRACAAHAASIVAPRQRRTWGGERRVWARGPPSLVGSGMSVIVHAKRSARLPKIAAR